MTRLGSRCQHRSVVLLVLFIVDAARGASVHKKVMSEEPVLIGALTSHEALELNGRVLDAANPGMFSSSVDCSDACCVLLEPDAPPVRDGAGTALHGKGARSLLQAYMPKSELLWTGHAGAAGYAMRIDRAWKATVNAIVADGVFEAYIANARLHRSTAAWDAEPSKVEDAAALPGLTAA